MYNPKFEFQSQNKQHSFKKKNQPSLHINHMTEFSLVHTDLNGSKY